MRSFGFTGTDKEISVRVRSDLYNIIKQQESVVNDYNEPLKIVNGGAENGKIHDGT